MKTVQNELSKLAISLGTLRRIGTFGNKGREATRAFRVSTFLESLKKRQTGFGKVGAGPAAPAAPGAAPSVGGTSSSSMGGGPKLPAPPAPPTASFQKQQLTGASGPGSFKNVATKKMMSPPGVGAAQLGVPPATPWAPPKLAAFFKDAQMAAPLMPSPLGSDMNPAPEAAPIEYKDPNPVAQDSGFSLPSLGETGSNVLSGAMMGSVGGLPGAAVGAAAGALYNPVLKPVGQAIGRGYIGALNALGAGIDTDPTHLQPGQVFTDRPQNVQETEAAARAGTLTEQEAIEYARYKGELPGGGTSVPNGMRLPNPGEEGYEDMVAAVGGGGTVDPSASYLKKDEKYAADHGVSAVFPRAGSARDVLMKLKMAQLGWSRLGAEASISDRLSIRACMEKDAGGFQAAAKYLAAKMPGWWRGTSGKALSEGMGGRAARWLMGGNPAATNPISRVMSGRAIPRMLGVGALGLGGLAYGITPSEQAMPGVPFLGRLSTTLTGGYLGGRAAEAADLPWWTGALAGSQIAPGLVGSMSPGGQGIGGMLQNPLVTGLSSYMLAKKFAPGGVAGIPPWALGALGATVGPGLVGGLTGGGQPIYSGQSGY